MTATLAVAGMTAQAADSPRVLSPDERLLVLPIEFAYYKYGTVPFEIATDKTEQARRNLAGSLHRALQRKAPLQFIELPELTAAEQATVREHTNLLWLMAISATDSLRSKTVPWRDKAHWRIDYSIGDGLSFLAERMQVDKALFVSGVRGDPEGGLSSPVGKPLPLGARPTTGNVNIRNFSAMVVDLRSGDVLAVYSPVRGILGEPLNQVGANTWMQVVFEDIPEHPLSEPPYNQPPARKLEPVSGSGYSFMPPKGWRPTGFGQICFRHHEATLERLCFDRVQFDKRVRDRGLAVDSDALAPGAVAMELLRSDPDFPNITVTSTTRARVAGRDGFRAELTSQLSIGDARLRWRHVVYGVIAPSGAYLLRLDAPAIYFFEHHLPEFEAVASALELR